MEKMTSGNSNNGGSDSSEGICNKLFTAIKASSTFQIIRPVFQRLRQPATSSQRTIEIQTAEPRRHRTTAAAAEPVPIKLEKSRTRQHQQNNSAPPPTAAAAEPVPIQLEKSRTRQHQQNDSSPPSGKEGVACHVEAGHEKKEGHVAVPDRNKHDVVSLKVPINNKGGKATGHLNRTFSEYINKTGNKIRTGPDVDQGVNREKTVTSCSDVVGSGIKKKGSFRDYCSDYIHQVKGKIRSSPQPPSSTTTTGGTSSYF